MNIEKESVSQLVEPGCLGEEWWDRIEALATITELAPTALRFAFDGGRNEIQVRRLDGSGSLLFFADRRRILAKSLERDAALIYNTATMSLIPLLEGGMLSLITNELKYDKAIGDASLACILDQAKSFRQTADCIRNIIRKERGNDKSSIGLVDVFVFILRKLHLNFSIDAFQRVLTEAVAVRHVLNHNNGVVDQDYIRGLSAQSSLFGRVVGTTVLVSKREWSLYHASAATFIDITAVALQDRRKRADRDLSAYNSVVAGWIEDVRNGHDPDGLELWMSIGCLSTPRSSGQDMSEET